MRRECIIREGDIVTRGERRVHYKGRGGKEGIEKGNRMQYDGKGGKCHEGNTECIMISEREHCDKRNRLCIVIREGKEGIVTR